MSVKLPCTTAKQADVLAAVIGERRYQDTKYGSIYQRSREVGAYLTLIDVKLADAKAAYARSFDDLDALDELRKVAALCVACFEQHDVPSRVSNDPVVNHASRQEK